MARHYWICQFLPWKVSLTLMVEAFPMAMTTFKTGKESEWEEKLPLKEVVWAWHPSQPVILHWLEPGHMPRLQGLLGNVVLARQLWALLSSREERRFDSWGPLIILTTDYRPGKLLSSSPSCFPSFCSSRKIFLNWKYNHVGPVLKTLPWFPMASGIIQSVNKYLVVLIMYQMIC